MIIDILILYRYIPALPKETLYRIWEIFIYERNWKIFFRISLAILELYENQLLNENLDGVIFIFIFIYYYINLLLLLLIIYYYYY